MEERHTKKKSEKTSRPPRPPKVVTPALVRAQALRYLDRFAATTMKLKRHLLTKNSKAIEFHALDPETIVAIIDTEVGKLEEAGILDDQEYASSKARTMSRQAKSKLQIEVKLQSLGFDESQADQAVTQLLEEDGHDDRLSAAKYIKKRRFGPYKPEDTRDERLNKELGTLVRNGFEFAMAKALLCLQTTDEIEKIIYDE